MCCFCAPNTCDTVLWQNLLELLTIWADTQDPDELCTKGSQCNIFDLLQQRHCQLQHTSCCNYILLQAQPWLDSPFLCGKGNVSAFGAIYCHAAADPVRQRCSSAAGKGSRHTKRVSVWQWGVTAQPSLTARRKPLVRLEKHAVKLQVGERGQRDTGACLTHPQKQSGSYLGMTFLGQLWLLPQPGLDPQLSAGKLGGFKASYESLMKFKGKSKEANYRLLTKALPQLRKLL